jgi:type I restriction enzyme S subunit
VELKRGYKQTEVGVIPEEWNVEPVSNLLQLKNGVNAEKRAYGRGIRFANVLEVITRPHLKASDVPGRIALGEGAIGLYRVQFGDVLFNRTSETQEEVGLSSVYIDTEPLVFGGFVIRGRPLNDEVLDAHHSGYAFRTPSVRSQIVARGQGAIRANIGQGDLRTVRVVVPPLPEQRAIAEVLGDVDALIGALDRLIAKKRDLKQAAMQQLLTGQTRLPGFDRSCGSLRQSGIGPIPSDWEAKPLRDGGQLLSGHHVLAQYCNTKGIGFPYITGPSDFPEGRIKHTKYTERPTTICRAGDILVTVKGSGAGTTVLADAEYCISRQLMAIRLLEWDINFVHASLSQDKSLFGAAAAGLIPGLSRTDILDKEIAVPSLPEQTAIASVLSDMDSELSALEERAHKTRLLKQGMMQELLTGRIRLS